MTTRTARERVMEAVTRGLEMVADLNEARGRLLIAKRQEDEVRLADRTKEIAEEANARQVDAQRAAETEFQEKIAQARQPLDAAQSRFDRAAEEFRQNCDQELERSRQEAEAAILEAQREQATRDAVAKAGVHTAQQEVAGLEADIDRYARQVEQQLGVNLKQLLTIARE